MKATDLVRRSLTPLVAVNFALMVASGVWLVFNNAMGAAWPGFIALMFSPLVFPYYLFPAAIFAGIMQVIAKSHPRAARLMTACSVGYLVLALSFYLTLSFGFAGPTRAGLVYGVAAGVAPWTIFNLKDRGNVFFTGLLMMMELAAISTACLVFWAGAALGLDFFSVWGLIFAQMAVMAGLQALYESRLPPQETAPPVAPSVIGDEPPTL